jgi:hypothetical protein
MEEIKDTSKSLRGCFITAICLLILDSFVLGQGAIAVITVIAVVFWFIPKTLFAWKQKQILINRALKVIIYSAMAATIFTANAINNHFAKTRADHIVIAVNEFKAQHQRFPRTLDELVPELLTEIPKAKFTLMFNNFVYAYMKDHATLMYFEFPPFGRPYYDFNIQEWGYID